MKDGGVNDLSIREKYHTPVAELYRERYVVFVLFSCLAVAARALVLLLAALRTNAVNRV